jgi:hypothetical protein
LAVKLHWSGKAANTAVTCCCPCCSVLYCKKINKKFAHVQILVIGAVEVWRYNGSGGGFDG